MNGAPHVNSLLMEKGKELPFDFVGPLMFFLILYQVACGECCSNLIF